MACFCICILLFFGFIAEIQDRLMIQSNPSEIKLFALVALAQVTLGNHGAEPNPSFFNV